MINRIDDSSAIGKSSNEVRTMFPGRKWELCFQDKKFRSNESSSFWFAVGIDFNSSSRWLVVIMVINENQQYYKEND